MEQAGRLYAFILLQNAFYFILGYFHDMSDLPDREIVFV